MQKYPFSIKLLTVKKIIQILLNVFYFKYVNYSLKKVFDTATRLIYLSHSIVQQFIFDERFAHIFVIESTPKTRPARSTYSISTFIITCVSFRLIIEHGSGLRKDYSN